MKNILLFLLLLSTSTLATGCLNDPRVIEIAPTEYDLELISYFNEIALGFEFGDASKITRKWITPMKIFVGGNPSEELSNELDTIVQEINSLATDGFYIELTTDENTSNYFIFFGTGDAYAALYPSQKNFVGNNWGLFSISYNSRQEIYNGHMYVDIDRASPQAQKHLLREELTQSLGLGNDSPRYRPSIFQSDWTLFDEYMDIDRDVIRLLYHPDMEIGLDETQTKEVIIKILLKE